MTSSKLYIRVLAVAAPGGELVTRVLALMFIAKVVANDYGPTVLAKYSSYYNLFSIVSVLSVVVVNSGMIHYLSNRDYESKKYIVYVYRAIAGTFYVAIISLLLSISLWTIYTQFFFNERSYLDLDTVVVYYIIISCIAYYVLISFTMLLNVARHLIKLAFFKILVTLFLLIFFVISIYLKDEQGVFYSVPMGYIVTGGLILWINRSHVVKISKRFTVYLKGFNVTRHTRSGIFLGLASVLGPGIQLFIRSEIIKSSGLTDAGYWDALWRISDAVSTLGVSYLLIFFIPHLARGKLKLSSKFILTLLIIFTTLYIILASVFVAYRNYLIPFLYSYEFIGIANYVGIILAVGYFRIIGAIFNYSVLIKGRPMAYFSNELFCAILFVCLIFIKKEISIQSLSLISLLISCIYTCISFYSLTKVSFNESAS